MADFFKSVDDLRLFLAGVQRHLSPEVILPFVSQAAIKHIVPWIGQEFYDEVNQAYQNDSQDANMKLAIPKVQQSLAYFTMLEAIPFLNVSVGDLGIHENNGEKTSPARQWSVYKLEDACGKNGEQFLDHLLLFLEANADDFTTWKESSEYTVSKELFISSTRELTRHINIGDSRRAYVVMRPFIRRMEDTQIVQLISQELCDDLKDKLKSDNLSEKEKTFLSKLRPAIACLAYANALPELAVSFEGNGLRILSDSDGIRQRAAASADQIVGVMRNTESAAMDYIKIATAYLNANADDFTAYKNSSLYNADSETYYQLPENSKESKAFIFP